MMYFGEPWDVPAVDEGVQGPTPVGRRCIHCPDPIEDGDQGFMMGTVRLGKDGEPVGSLEPVHRECHLRSVTGSIAHLEGKCICHGVTGSDHDDDRSWREQGREIMAWLRRRGQVG